MSGELISLREDLVDFSERNGVRKGVELARRGDAARGSYRRANIRRVKETGMIVKQRLYGGKIVGFQGANQESTRLVGHSG